MKRVLFVIPVFLLVIVNACASGGSVVAPPLGTAVGETQTASVWTPTISPTPDPDESKIVEWLNAELSDSDALEQTVDAKYQVVDVSFPAVNGLVTAIRVDVRCECAMGGPCCIPERTFVVTIASLKKRAEKILEQVPGTVNELKVVCYDHLTQVGVMSASWMDVKGYFMEQINGYQLGSRVYRSSAP
jgi:hypothetical protein